MLIYIYSHGSYNYTSGIVPQCMINFFGIDYGKHLFAMSCLLFMYWQKKYLHIHVLINTVQIKQSLLNYTTGLYWYYLFKFFIEYILEFFSCTVWINLEIQLIINTVILNNHRRINITTLYSSLTIYENYIMCYHCFVFRV